MRINRVFLISHEFPASRRLMNDEMRPVRKHHMFVCSAAPQLFNYRTSGQARASSGTAGRAETGTRPVGAESDCLGTCLFLDRL